MKKKDKKQIANSMQELYESSFRLCNVIWEKVNDWNSFQKRSLGETWVKTADGVSAHLIGLKALKKKKDLRTQLEKIGTSVNKNIDILEKARHRSLLNPETYAMLLEGFHTLKKDLKMIKLVIRKN